MGKVNKIDVAEHCKQGGHEGLEEAVNELDDKMEIVQGSEKRTKPQKTMMQMNRERERGKER